MRTTKSPISIVCLNCSNNLQVSYKERHQRFCSQKCNASYHGKLRYKNNPDYYVELTKIMRNSEKYTLTRPRKESHYKWKDVSRVKICCHCSKNYSIKPYRILKSKFCSNACRMKGVRYNSSIEQKLQVILNKLNIPYTTQKHISNIDNKRKYTFVDIFIEPNIVIYADGDYWHSLKKTAEHDTYVNEFLIKQGYKIMRFSEDQINNHITKVKNDLMLAVVLQNRA